MRMPRTFTGGQSSGNFDSRQFIGRLRPPWGFPVELTMVGYPGLRDGDDGPGAAGAEQISGGWEPSGEGQRPGVSSSDGPAARGTRALPRAVGRAPALLSSRGGVMARRPNQFFDPTTTAFRYYFTAWRLRRAYVPDPQHRPQPARLAEVPPVSWTPEHLCSRSPSWPESTHPSRLSSGVR